MIPALNSIRNRLRFRQLTLIGALAEHGSLSRAAEQVGLTQPAATRMIHEAERAFGLTLFERMPHGMRPTIYGEAVIEYARRLASDLEGLRSELVALDAGSSGRVNVGAIVAAVPQLFAEVHRRLEEQGSGLLINLRVETSDILIQELRFDKLDVVIGRIPVEDGNEDLKYEPLDEEELAVVSSVAHPLAGRERVSVAELRACPWVMQPYPSPMRYLADRLFRNARAEPPESRFETSSTLAAIDLIAANDSLLAMVPLTVARRFAPAGMLTIVPAQLDVRLSPFGMITRDKRMLPVAARRFMETMRDVSRDLREADGGSGEPGEAITKNGMGP